MYLNQFTCTYDTISNMIFFQQKLAFLLLLLTKNSEPDQVKDHLKQLPDGRYYKPGRSCGILNSIKLMSKMPETVDEIEGCTIIDLSPRPIPRPSVIPERGKVFYYTILLIIEGMFNGAIVD